MKGRYVSQETSQETVLTTPTVNKRIVILYARRRLEPPLPTCPLVSNPSRLSKCRSPKVREANALLSSTPVVVRRRAMRTSSSRS